MRVQCRAKVYMYKYLFVVLIFVSEISQASKCSGDIDMLLVTRNGAVELYSEELYGTGTGRTLCYVNAEWKSVSADICRVWYSTLLAKSAQSKPAAIHYNFDSVVPSCSDVSTYGSAISPWAVSDK